MKGTSFSISPRLTFSKPRAHPFRFRHVADADLSWHRHGVLPAFGRGGHFRVGLCDGADAGGSAGGGVGDGKMTEGVNGRDRIKQRSLLILLLSVINQTAVVFKHK